ncbi:hypothetical protein ACS0TY_027668 [Phlomoides rotata]
MAISAKHIMSLILILGLLITLSLDFTVGQIGVDYGRNGGGLPPPSRVVELYNQYGIQRMRIYDTDPETLQAVGGSNIELTVGILNRDLQNIAASPTNADAWVRDNISKYPNVKFRHIVVGNEVSPINGDTSQYVPFVLPAMQNIYNAVSAAGHGGIKVTTAIDTEVLEPSKSYPPEDGEFRSNVAPYLNPIIRFLMDTDAPIFASIYPYFAYINNPQQIDLRYALLDPSFEGVTTPNGVRYQNLYYALLDALYAALERSAASMSLEAATDASGGTKKTEVKGGESGWRSGGGGGHARLESTADDVSNVDNARMYVNNLVQAVKKGSPKRPDQPIETYIFAMFDEDQKPGDEGEKHFGLFTPDGNPKFPVNFN